MKQINFSVPTEIEFQLIFNYAKSFNLDCDNLGSKQFIVARINMEMAGFARLKEHSDCIELSTLGVLPGYRRNGVGQHLIDNLLKTTESEKIHLVTVIPEYFQKSGFKLTNDIPVSLKLKNEDCKFHCSSDTVSVMVLEKKFQETGNQASRIKNS